jgi:hypothetical protein
MLHALQLRKLSKPAAQALAKRHQKRQQEQGGSSGSKDSTAGNRAPAVSKHAGSTSSKKKTKKQLNFSNVRARPCGGVQKRSAKLSAVGDAVIFINIPLNLNAKVRTVLEGVTQEQACAVLKAYRANIDWEDERLQKKIDEWAAGTGVP